MGKCQVTLCVVSHVSGIARNQKLNTKWSLNPNTRYVKKSQEKLTTPISLKAGSLRVVTVEKEKAQCEGVIVLIACPVSYAEIDLQSTFNSIVHGIY